jgi:hypothetical protein
MFSAQTTTLYPFYPSKTGIAMKEPKIQLGRYQRFIELIMHAFIVVVLLGIFLKVLVI